MAVKQSGKTQGDCGCRAERKKSRRKWLEGRGGKVKAKVTVKQSGETQGESDCKAVRGTQGGSDCKAEREKSRRK